MRPYTADKRSQASGRSLWPAFLISLFIRSGEGQSEGQKPLKSPFLPVISLIIPPYASDEDHPQRALYSALRMQNELRRYSAKVIAEGGIPIQCRVGANTGEVVVRSISTGRGHTEYTPIGHTANLASRMQADAPAGSIAASD